MIRLKSFTLPGCRVLIRVDATTGIIEMPEGEGVQIVAGEAYHHVAHTLDQMMSAMSKVRPSNAHHIDDDNSVFARLFGK